MFDGTLMCSDCMENSSNYSKDPDYQSRRGLEAVGGAEFQQCPTPPPSYTSCHLEATGLVHDPSLCNRVANGMREFPQHHSLLQHQHGTGEDRLPIRGESGTTHPDFSLAADWSHGDQWKTSKLNSKSFD